jgi:MazG family protein
MALSTSGEVLAQWEQIKTDERRRKGVDSMFAGVPPALPALLKALRVSAKAARVGFDWPDRDSLFDKLREEIEELRAALATGKVDRIEDEIGDVLFTVANVARAAAIDPEAALQAATRKFMDRFRHVEKGLGRAGLRPAPEHRDRMERLWLEAKRRVRKSAPDRTSPSGGTSGTGARRAHRRGRS